MIFGATYACSACMLRFARCDACPSCGGAIVSLSDHSGRATVRGGRRSGVKGGVLLSLARWAPSRPWIPIAIGLAMALPATATLVLSPSWLLETWLVDDRRRGEPRLSIEHRDLSWRGIQILAVGGAGLLLAALTTAAWLGQRAAAPAPPPKRLRVYARDREGEGEGTTVITGVARLATAEIESPLGGEPCLVVGLRGDVDGEQVEDADGGDFDLVTPEGRVFMVSLEHARLEPHGDEEPIELTVAEAVELEPFLLDRVGQRVRERCTFAETVVAAGDTVSVTAKLAGKALATAPFRDEPRGRVLTGAIDCPLVVRLVTRAART